MVDASITHAPDPCDRPAWRPMESRTHSHDDGRRCIWDAGQWLTVQSVSEPLVSEPQNPDWRVTLDPILDPAARPALALYAQLLRAQSRGQEAEVLEGRLARLDQEVGKVLDAQDTDPVSIRVIASWSYSAYRQHYITAQRTAAGMADQDANLNLDELLPGGDEGSLFVRLMPGA